MKILVVKISTFALWQKLYDELGESFVRASDQDVLMRGFAQRHFPKKADEADNKVIMTIANSLPSLHDTIIVVADAEGTSMDTGTFATLMAGDTTDMIFAQDKKAITAGVAVLYDIVEVKDTDSEE